MAPDRQERLEEIFTRALQAGSADERRAYLDGACGNDADLRARIESLLGAHDAAGSFLEKPVVGADRAVGEGPGSLVGPYKLLQRIGEGGFGVVYMAEQQKPVRRRVALKIIKLGMDTKQVIARFEAERQALALMDHPNISRVLDAGATAAGRPFFVMDLVRGIPIDEYCDKNNLATPARIELMRLVCRAVQHAHQKGIIHRDIKPGNILVTLHDGVPVPKVIDFGIARATNRQLTEKTLFTEFGQFIGTPEYMSPEQAEMSGLDIDTRTDIYSLGVLLYQLLTGTTPLDAAALREAGYGEIQRIIREEEPPIPSTRVSTLGEDLGEIARHRATEPGSLRKLMRGDLDWIVMKALEKDRTRRYASASEMAQDLGRHLDREPVLAGPPSVIYKLRKLVARHRVGVLAGLLVVGAMLFGLTGATYGFLKARREAERSQKIADNLQDLLLSGNPEQAGSAELDAERVVATAKEVFGDDHATVAAALSSRALQLQSAGSFAAAERLYRESLSIWRTQKDDVQVGRTLRLLGSLHQTKGDDDGAEAAFRESLERLGYPDSPPTLAQAETLVGLADVEQNRGDFGAAEQGLRESVRIRRLVAPHQRLQIAGTVNLLANVMVMKGSMQDALPIVRETLAAWRAALPDRGRLLAKVLIQIGAFEAQVGNVDDGEALIREGMEIYRNPEDLSVMFRQIGLKCLKEIVSSRDDGSDAYVATYLAFLDYVRDLFGEEAVELAMLRADGIRYLRKHDRPELAVKAGLAALPVLVAAGGEYTERATRTLERLEEILEEPDLVLSEKTREACADIRGLFAPGKETER